LVVWVVRVLSQGVAVNPFSITVSLYHIRIYLSIVFAKVFQD